MHYWFEYISNLFILPLAGAGLIFALFKFLGKADKLSPKSEPLKTLITDWITDKNQNLLILRQLQMIQNKIFGKSMLSFKRHIAISSIFFVIFVSLIVSAISTAAFKPTEIGLLQQYSLMYFIALEDYTSLSFFFLIIAYVVNLVAFSAIDGAVKKLSSSNIIFSHQIVSSILIYIFVFVFITMLSGFIPDLIRFNSGGGLFPVNEADESIINLRSGTSIGFIKYAFAKFFFVPNEAISLIKSINNNEDFGPAIMLEAALGTALICFSAVLIATSIHIIYYLSLMVMKSEFNIRSRFHLNNDSILKDPLEYIGYIAGSMAFILLLSCGFLGTLLSYMIKNI